MQYCINRMSVCILVLQQMVYAHIRKGDGEWYSCKTKYLRICESLATLFILWLHFYCQTSLNLWLFDFLFCSSKKYLLWLYPIFWHAHSTHHWPSMNFGLQLSLYKFRTISSKATSIDYNHHPNFSSDPTNIHDCGFRFRFSTFLIGCG